MVLDHTQQSSAVLKLYDRRDAPAARMLGHLVSLNGMHAILSTRVAAHEVGASWSIGHLITIIQGATRLVGVVCEITAANHVWHETEANVAHVKIKSRCTLEG